jgi:mono/diheme cytochrome c family protein
MYRRTYTMLLAPLLFVPLLACAAEPVTEAKKPYRAVDGKVDDATYLGWRAFHSGCHICHGVGAGGTVAAPNLVERIKDLSAQDFTTKVLTSYRFVFDSSEVGGEDTTAVRQKMLEEILRRERGELVMPAWEQSSTVRPHVLDIYGYLRARADGVLGPGTPEKLKK